MEAKRSVSPVLLTVTIALVVALVAFMAFRSFGGSDNGSAAGGAEAKTMAPVAQQYPNGAVVPYNAAPAGATPGNPASIRR